MIHIITMITTKNQKTVGLVGNKRTQGYFFDLETAKKCVQENWMDIYENEYELAVIETVSEGPYTYDLTGGFWYQYNGSGYDPIPKPEQFKHIVGFGHG